MWIDDDILKRCAEPVAQAVWVPDSNMVVLGCSNKAEVEVREDNCKSDGIPVLKRYGGGGTVLLYDGCVVVSLGCWVRQQFQNQLYFAKLNQAVIDCLAELSPGAVDYGQAGLSDITIGDRKIAGTSLFRSRHYLLYQASILVQLAPDLIDRYLAHPSREPDYRQGRRHSSFLTDLQSVAPGTNAAAACAHIQDSLPRAIERQMQGELTEPDQSHFRHLAARVQRAEQATT